MPWAAVSLAAHGLLLYMFYIRVHAVDVPVSLSGSQVMIVALQDGVVTAARDEAEQDISYHSLSHGSHTEATEAVGHGAVATGQYSSSLNHQTMVTNSRHQPKRTSSGTASIAASTAANHVTSHTVVEQNAEMQEQRLQRVRQHLERFKYYPTSARRRGIEGQVEVAFDLDARGMASGLQLLSRSGYHILDQAALETVRRASPFPVRGGHYRFHLVFRQS